MAKKRIKRQPKQLLLPIFALSLVVGIGMVVWQNLLKPTPIQIAEIGQSSNCSQIAFADNFDSTTLDPAKWFAYSETGGTAAVNNQATLTVPSGATKDFGSVSLFSEGKVEMEGDFVHEVTLSSLTTNPSTSQTASFALGIAAPGWANWYRIEAFKYGDIQTFGITNNVTTTGTATPNIYTGQSIKLKMIRTGSTLTTYYGTGADEILHTTLKNIYTGKVFVELVGLSHGPDKPQVTAVVDDYSLKCLPPKPTNLVSTCSQDGTKVTLRWDDVSPGKYHFALNDLVETDEDWFKPGTTDVWRGGDYDQSSYELPVVPGRTYNWWVHSNEAGQFTNRSVAASASFKCEPKPATPTNLRHTCSPDGKSVRLMWDAVANVDFYKLRLDDKKGNVKSIDGLTGNTEHVVAVTPGQTYIWWGHSSRSGYDSLETERKEFKCNASTTPTPTALPAQAGKPTVKPSTTPTPSPVTTPTPSPKVLFDNTPSSTPDSYDVVPSPASTVSEPVKKSNPISRFFTWLAGLFE